jgi:hypothetical protein
MSEWIDRLAKKESGKKSAEQQRQANEAAAAERRARVLEARGQDYIERVRQTAGTQCAEWNEKVPDRRLDYQRTPRGFDANIMRYPAAGVRCDLNASAGIVEAVITRRQSADHPGERREFANQLDVDGDERIIARCDGQSFNEPELLVGYLLESALR